MFDICANKLLINQLKCNQCSKILSVPPVYYSSSKGNICSRCFDAFDSSIKDNSMQQAVTYEAVAQFLLFPCSNHEHGCKTKLNWKEEVQHEEECEFALSPCPFNLEFERPRRSFLARIVSLVWNTFLKLCILLGHLRLPHPPLCDWTGTRKNLNQHLHDNHENDLQLELISSALNLDVTFVNKFFTVVDNVIFLVITQFVKTSNKFYCAVICCEDSTKHRWFRYQLELGHNNNCNDLILPKPETERFSNVQGIINHVEKMIVVDFSVLPTLVYDLKKSIYYKISILKNPKLKNQNEDKLETDSEISESESNASSSCSELKVKEQSNENNANDNEYLKELECPVCNENMVPPIFLCPTGHSICNSCKSKLRLCPTCRSTIQDGRNFTLEKLTTTLKYPCIYQNIGCKVRLNHKQLEWHQLGCPYVFVKCPWRLHCNDKNIVDLIEHICHKHSDIILNVNRFYMYKGMVIRPATFDNQAFIFCFKYAEQLKFNIIHIPKQGMNNTKSKYKYKLEFRDQTNNKLQLIVSQLCQLIQPFNFTSALEKSLTIPQQMVEPFIVKNEEPKVELKFNFQKL